MEFNKDAMLSYGKVGIVTIDIHIKVKYYMKI